MKKIITVYLSRLRISEQIAYFQAVLKICQKYGIEAIKEPLKKFAKSIAQAESGFKVDSGSELTARLAELDP